MYCSELGKVRRKFESILCSRHYRQLLKYGKTIPTRYDKNDIYVVIKTNRFDLKIDLEDVARCQMYKWRMCGNDYPFAKINDRKVYLQNFILGTEATVDHINHDIYDCRKENLREVNKSENMMNSKISKRNTSGVKGVSFDKRDNKWMAHIYLNGKFYNLGRYSDFNVAVKTRFSKEIELFGDKSVLHKGEGVFKLLYSFESEQYELKYVNGVISLKLINNEGNIKNE